MYDAEHNGYPRNNPDGTLYPGDAFEYSADYGFSRYCISPRIIIETSGSLHDTQGERTVRVGRTGSIMGMIEILIRESLECLGERSAECGSLTVTARAREIHCGALHPVCWYEWHEEYSTISPRVIQPRISLILDVVPLLDADGYATSNMDKTSYPHDPITVQHEADFAWKNERRGTIEFEYERRFSPLVDGGGFECASRCLMPLVPSEHYIGIDFLSENYDATNGGGMYVYAAHTNGTGAHKIEYSASVLNLGREIASGRGVIEHKVVPYNPAYEHYAYVVFRDGGYSAYEKRHGLALYYKGSYENDTLYENRRSKINGVYYRTYAASEDGAAQIELDSKLHWSEARAIGGSSFSSLDEHAMFESAGYGVIRFSQDVSVVLKNTDRHGWYGNVTTHGVLNSDSWAGGNRTLVEYSYRYPDTGLSSWFNVTVLPDSAGGSAISVNAAPVLGANVISLEEYLASKVVHDTGCARFADAVMSDLYRMENFAHGTGAVSMRVNKTHLEFPTLLLESVNDTMDIPIHEALSMPARMHFDIAVDKIQRDIMLPFEFDVGYHETANIGDDNKVWYKRTGSKQDGNKIIFRTDDSFGIASRADIHGIGTVYLHDNCSEGCTLHVGQNPANVMIYNAWNGTASLHVPGITPYTAVHEPAFLLPTNVVILIMSVVLVALLIRAMLGRITST